MTEATINDRTLRSMDPRSSPTIRITPAPGLVRTGACTCDGVQIPIRSLSVPGQRAAFARPARVPLAAAVAMAGGLRPGGERCYLRVGKGGGEASSFLEEMPSFPKMLRRCHSTVRELRKSWLPISGFE